MDLESDYRPWSELIPDLLIQIKKPLSLPDLIRFDCVCKSWRSLSVLRHKGRFPWLLVPCLLDYNIGQFENYSHDGVLGFFSILDGLTYKIEIPELLGRRILGVSFGWLITVHENSELQLLHPFSKKVVHLPPLTKLPYAFGTRTDQNGVLFYLFGDLFRLGEISDWPSNEVRDIFLYKAITSSNPDPDSSHSPIVIIMENNQRSLYYFRSGKDDCWAIVPGLHLNYDDFTFYEGDFYVLDCKGEVGIVKGLDGDGSSPFISPLSLRKCDDMAMAGEESLYYLVATSTDLLMVIRDYNDWVDEDSESYRTTKGFRVFKLDFSCTNAPKWVVTKDIGDCALFLGTNNSFSVVPSDFRGCRCNCIYFTSHDMETPYYSGNDKGIFNLDDCMIEGVCPIDCKTICPRPLWYSTNP